MDRIFRYSGYITYWSIVLIPFFAGIAPAPMNVFMGLLIFFFLLKKLLKKENIFARTTVNLPLLIFFIITCLSIINSVSYKDSLKGGIFRLLQYILVFFAMADGVKDKRHIHKIVFSITLGVIFVALDEVFQTITGKDLVRGYQPMIIMGLARATASFKDPNTLGVYLSAFSAILLGLTLFYFKGAKKTLFIIISLLALLGIALTYSRPTFLAVYVVFIMFALMRRSRGLMIFMIMITLISPFIAPRQVKEWARQVDYNPIRFMCNDDRIAIYRNSLNMIRAHPLIGLGANTYMKNYKKYKESPEYRNVVTADTLYAHNNFLHLAAEVGLIGLLVFLWFLYQLFRGSILIYQRLSGYIQAVALSLIACLAAFLINGLTESSFYSSRVALIFWYLAGLMFGLAKLTYRDG